MTQRRRLSRRSLFGPAAALAGAVLLPMPALAAPRSVKFTLSWLAQGSFVHIYVARAKGIMKARGIDFEIARDFGSMASAQSIAGGQFDFGIEAQDGYWGMPVKTVRDPDGNDLLFHDDDRDSGLKTP